MTEYIQNCKFLITDTFTQVMADINGLVCLQTDNCDLTHKVKFRKSQKIYAEELQMIAISEMNSFG